jgi:hypothetical protein
MFETKGVEKNEIHIYVSYTFSISLKFSRYSKLPAIWDVWGMGCTSYMNLPFSWKNLCENPIQSQNNIFLFSSCMGVFLLDTAD